MVYVNGRIVPRPDAKVGVEDRGYQFADGIYEVTKFIGRRPIRLGAHLARVKNSCDHMRIRNAPSSDDWRSIITELQEACEMPDDPGIVQTLYMQVTRGEAPRSHLFPKTEVPPGVVSYFRTAPIYTPEQRETGLSLSSQPDERWSRCYIKSICLLPVIMAKQAAVDAGASEAMLVRDCVVTEGASTNIFCVKDGTVFTHPEGPHILSGVTRILVREAAAKAGIPLQEVSRTLKEFQTADEVFLSSTTMDIMPITSIDNQPVGDGRVGPVTRRLMQTFQDIIEIELSTALATA